MGYDLDKVEETGMLSNAIYLFMGLPMIYRNKDCRHFYASFLYHSIMIRYK